MKETQSYINHQLNTSVYRNSCKFSKADRFKPIQFTYLYQHSDPPILIITFHPKNTQELQEWAMDSVLVSKVFKAQVLTPTMFHNFQETKEQLLLGLIVKKQYLET